MRASLAIAAMMAVAAQETIYGRAPRQQVKQPRLYTHADEERQRKAEEKRQRKAAKRARASGEASK